MTPQLLQAVARRLFQGVLDWPFPRPTATALVEREGEIGPEYLFVRVSGPDGDRWILPGGGIEVGESPGEAAVREVREETGLRVTACEAVDAYDFEASMGPHVAVVVRCASPSGTLRTDGNPDSEPITDARWVPREETAGLAVPEDLDPVLERLLGG